MELHQDSNGVTVEHDDEFNPPGHFYAVAHGGDVSYLAFQKGPVAEVGVNGMTSEALLAALIHRTRCLNDQFPCRENAIAITKMEEALMWFEKRTRDRQARGVEGLGKA